MVKPGFVNKRHYNNDDNMTYCFLGMFIMNKGVKNWICYFFFHKFIPCPVIILVRPTLTNKFALPVNQAKQVRKRVYKICVWRQLKKLVMIIMKTV